MSLLTELTRNDTDRAIYHGGHVINTLPSNILFLLKHASSLRRFPCLLVLFKESLLYYKHPHFSFVLQSSLLQVYGSFVLD